jgi:PAS domain S-box-containing protein
MFEFFRRFFSTDGFMPHGMCYEWNPTVIWLNVISDGLIALAYFSIPLTLVYFVHRRKALQFRWIYICFALFIVSCGTTHLMEIWNIWHPVYWLTGSIKALTAGISIVTAILLIYLVPTALALPSPQEFKETHQFLGERTRELAASQARLQAVLDATTEIGIIASDPAGLITFFNSGAEKMLGYAAEEIVGKHSPAIFHLDSEVTERGRELTEKLGRPVQGFDVFVELTRQGEFEEREWTYVRNDGTQVPVFLIVTSINDASGKLIGFVGISRDITARKLYESKLLEAKERSEQADRAKSEFLATMSHEIRTPMNGVIGMTELLLDSRLDADQRKLAETIRASGESLMGLLNDILDFSKIESGQLSLEEIDFDIRKVVEHSLDLMAGQARAKGITLAGAVDPGKMTAVRGDPGRLRQILTNLISNAIKFTNVGEVSVRGSVEAGTESDISVRFEIKDTGIGISPETQRRLFQPFVQADSSTSRKFGGTGLGLAICKRLAESMGGSIGVNSTLGEGSTFWVVLHFPRQTGEQIEQPAAARITDNNASESHEAPPLMESNGATELRTERILLAEDNSVNQEVALRNLRKLGYSADVVTNGFEVLHALESRCYDIILMDCHMPDLDGYEATREIRAREGQVRHTWIIAMTANVMTGDREKCLAAGMDDYISKPLDRSELHAALARRADIPVKPLSADFLSKLKADDEEQLSQLIALFVESAPVTFSAMRQAQENSNAADLVLTAHTLKGSCSNFGPSPLRDLCAQIEQFGLRGNVDEAANLIGSAEKELDRLIEALQPYRNPKLSL